MSQTFGPYELERELARGGMGVVHAARHRETGGAYALKTIRPAGAVDLDELERFQREAALLSRLDHPGIVRVHTAGVQDGVAYLVMALLPGGSLRDRLREGGPMPGEEASALVAALADAVSFAHARGVLHRDLKPENVLFDEAGRPVLVDFGLGRDLGAESRRLTETGQVLGTPGYMAPEQVEGGRRDDPRTDVYGLGALLFALVAGRPPFTGRGLGVLARIVSEPPPDLAALAPEAPAPVVAVVAKCLAKNPEERFATAADLARALRSQEAPARGGDRRRLGLVGLLLIASISVGVLAAQRSAPPDSGTSNPAPAPTPSASPTAAPAPEAPGDEAWEKASWVIQDDPVKAAELVKQARGRPSPAAARRLREEAMRQAAAMNTGERIPLHVSKEYLRPEHRRIWLSCLRVFRRVSDGPIPPAMLSDLPEVVSRLPIGATAFVHDVVLTIDGQYVPGLAGALMEFISWLKAKELFREWWPLCRRLVLLVPRERAQEWRQARLQLVSLSEVLEEPLATLSEVGDDAKTARARQRDVVGWCQELLRQEGLAPEEQRAVARAQASAALRLGDAKQAEGVARRGWKELDDRPCQGLLAVALAALGRDRAALEVARGYVAASRSRSGKLLFNVVFGICWDLGRRVELEHELRGLVQVRPDFNGWRLREVWLLVTLRRPEEAAQKLSELQEAIRRRGPSFPADEKRFPILSLKHPGQEEARLERLIERLDRDRRQRGEGLP